MASTQGDYPVAEVAAAIRAATRRTRSRRSLAERASDTLADAATKYRDQLTGAELDAIAGIRHALEEIVEGQR